MCVYIIYIHVQKKEQKDKGHTLTVLTVERGVV